MDIILHYICRITKCSALFRCMCFTKSSLWPYRASVFLIIVLDGAYAFDIEIDIDLDLQPE